MSHHRGAVPAAGVDPGQRQLNGPQTTGRSYAHLSEPRFRMARDDDVPVPVRDGVSLLVDVHRPDDDQRFPALVSASPYPRQIQDLGAPMGFVEAGASDFFVPRGYVHVIANLRGTGGSGGTFGFFDAQERRDLHDLVEWAAAQPWCDGNVGMVGISYFAMSQLEAAVERPEHLRAIFPLAVSPDLFEAARHHGLFSASFVSPFLTMMGIAAGHGDPLWRGHLLDAARHVLAQPRIHQRFATMNGEASLTLMKEAMRLHYDPHPWDDLWQAAAVDHQVRDAWWDERNVLSLLDQVDIPVYLGCDWQNVPLHLPGTFSSLAALRNSPEVRVGMLGDFGLTWPWESMHVEALAWFDHWLKGADTGILDGPPIRYWLPGADEWRTATEWPPAEARFVELALRSDGTLGDGDHDAATGPGSRSYVCPGPGLDRRPAQPTDPPTSLTWETGPLTTDLDVVGDLELRLDATATAIDTAWIALLLDVAPDGTAETVTQGWLQASLREVDAAASTTGAAVLPCRSPAAVPIGEVVPYRIPLVPNARRFAAGHRLRLVVCSDDRPDDIPVVMGFRHAPVGSTSHNTIHSSSRLVLSTLPSS
jgi:putative CocE/NonD family hydrolase